MLLWNLPADNYVQQQNNCICEAQAQAMCHEVCDFENRVIILIPQQNAWLYILSYSSPCLQIKTRQVIH